MTPECVYTGVTRGRLTHPPQFPGRLRGRRRRRAHRQLAPGDRRGPGRGREGRRVRAERRLRPALHRRHHAVDEALPARAPGPDPVRGLARPRLPLGHRAPQRRAQRRPRLRRHHAPAQRQAAPGRAVLLPLPHLRPLLARSARFRTLRPADSNEPVRIGFFSCQEWNGGFYTAHAALAEEQDLDVVVCLGDYIYERNYYESGARTDTTGPNRDGDVQTLPEYRDKYRLYHTDSNLLRVRETPLAARDVGRPRGRGQLRRRPRGGGHPGQPRAVPRAPRQRLPGVLRAHAARPRQRRARPHLRPGDARPPRRAVRARPAPLPLRPALQRRRRDPVPRGRGRRPNDARAPSRRRGSRARSRARARPGSSWPTR